MFEQISSFVYANLCSILVCVILLIGIIYVTEAYKSDKNTNKSFFTLHTSKHFYVNGAMVRFIDCESFIDVTQIVFMKPNVDSAPNYGIYITMNSGATCLIKISSPQAYFEFGGHVAMVKNEIFKHYN